MRGWKFILWLAVACALRGQTDPGPVNMTDRESARQWFNTWWPKSYGAPMGFTGDVANGVAGDVSQAYKDETLLRLNIYRRMAGEQPVTTNPTYDAKSQAAAVLCAANDQLSHAPPTTWKFYNATAAEGCQNSDLAGIAGPTGVYGLILDPGAENAIAGHREQLLDPALKVVGMGSAPPALNATNLQGALAVWNNDPSWASTDLQYNDPLVIWPRGYVPYYLIPGRWSAIIPDASTAIFLDLSTANVSVARLGQSIITTSVHQTAGIDITFTLDGTSEGSSGYTTNTINGEPLFLSAPSTQNDVVYHVAISGIKIRATGALFNGTGIYEYDVISYNPDANTILPGKEANLINISTRSFAGSSSSTQIAGFIIAGSSPRKVLIRAGGPYLSQFSVSNVLDDPVLTLFAGSSRITSNDDWGTDSVNVAAATKKVNATPFTVGSKDAAIVATLQPGVAYTAQVVGKGDATGNAIVEVYDADDGTDSRMINISTRSFVGTGSSIQIGGFILHGPGPRKVLIRAGGPYLSQAGVSNVLADPVLTIFDGTTQIAQNDDWDSNRTDVTEASQAANVPPYSTGSKDSAIVLTLDPGKAYTAQVTGKNGSSGNGLIEIFALP